MKGWHQVLAGIVALGSTGAAMAEDAYLRLRCDGEAAGAMVSINGVRKGECPIDLTVPEGTLQLSVRKTISQHSFKLYEKEMFLAGGAMKRETVELGPLQFTAEGQRLENERLARLKAEQEAHEAAENARKAREKAEAEAKAAALAEQQRLAAEEAARYGLTQDYLDIISSKQEVEGSEIFLWTTVAAYSPIFLPISTLSDLASGKKLMRTAADPAAFANPDAMVAKVHRQSRPLP